MFSSEEEVKEIKVSSVPMRIDVSLDVVQITGSFSPLGKIFSSIRREKLMDSLRETT